jgi:putative transposase
MSKSISLAPGARVVKDGKPYLIARHLDLEVVLAKESETGKYERLRIKDLSPPAETIPSGQAKAEELSLISQEDWQEAERRLTIIRPLLAEARRTRKMVDDVARANGVHATTIYRWLDLYQQWERASALIAGAPSGGRGASRLQSEAEKILQATIEDFYLTNQKYSVKKTYDELQRRCRNAQVAAPHINTLRNRIKMVSAKEKTSRREGKQTAERQHAAFPGHFPGADWPLAVVQIDHTLLDIMLVDDIHRLSIGRPWITLAIDVFSRMVVGFYVSLDPPGAMATGLCIANAMLPKEKWLARYDIEIAWPCWGLIRRIHVDNAGEFRGQMLRRACQEYGIDLEWRPVKKPHYGGHIERLLGTFSKEIHALPGATFSNPDERGQYNSEENAAMTLAEFEKWLITYVVGVYHQRAHSSLKTSPIKQYEKGIFGDEERPGCGLPNRLLDEDRLRLDFMPYIERTVQQYGVVVDDIHYYSDVLRRFVNAMDPDRPKNKRKFIFKRDPRDISVLYFHDPELKQYFEIPYRDSSHPPMNVWDLRAAKRRIEDEGMAEINESLIFNAYEQMRAQEERAVTETKQMRRARQRRFLHQQIARPGTMNDHSAAPSDEADMEESLPRVKPFDDLEELD